MGQVQVQAVYPAVEVCGSDVAGRGAFAGGYIACGTVVLPLTGKVLQRHEFDTSDYSLHVLQIDADAFLLAQGGPDDYINHSCAPNLAFTSDGKALRAIKDITLGEELYFDYSTSENDPNWAMPCQCGAPSCRKVVTAFCNLTGADKYSLLKYAMPYIREQYKGKT